MGRKQAPQTASQTSVLPSRIRDFLYSPFGTILRPVHAAAVWLMVIGLGWVDAFRIRVRPDPRLADLVTVAVKTFERPAAISRFLKAARRVFTGRIVVADDSRVAITTKDPLVDVIVLPFASGVSRGRNAALAAVDTPYVLVCDDDLVFTHASRWERAVDYLERNPDVDGVVGFLVELPRWYSIALDESSLVLPHRPPLRPDGDLIDGLHVAVFPPQIYLARTASIRRIGWSDPLKVVDHSDFFARASGELVFVRDPNIVVYHARTPWNRFYTSFRENVSPDLALLGRLGSSQE